MSDERPVLLWDAECGFCRRWVERVAYRAGDAIEIAPFQDNLDRFPELEAAELARAAHLVDTGGSVYLGADAILRAGALAPGPAPVLWMYQHLPGFRPITDAVYGWVAGHRRGVSRGVALLFGDDLLPRQYRLTRWLFLRLLGLVALLAFVSLMVQIGGLAGDEGISPARDYLAALERAGASRDWSWLDYALRAPTLIWLAPSTTGLYLVCAVGIAAAVLLIVDLAPPLTLLVTYACYLSVVIVCGPFLPFQWDTLLLETLVVAMFLVPWRLRTSLRADREPTWVGIWLLRLLVFKLMFMAGLVKVYGDPSWRELTALDYHFFTQPIPTWTAYYAHHAELLHGVGTLLTLAVELTLPFLLFAPRRLRFGFFAGTVLLMVLIGATGNYGFFNLLTVVIALGLLDDAMLKRVVPRRWRERLPELSRRPAAARRWAVPIALVLALPLVTMGFAYSKANLDRGWQAPGPLRTVMAKTHFLYLTRSYGLFAGMTTERPEVVIEGSRDGQTWEAYEFRYKVQDLDDVPSFAGPHMPRLDWQMWFAALRPCRATPWFHRFLERLLQGSEAVRNLLARDPFGDEPPRYIRSYLYQYSFAGDDRLGGEDDGVESGRWFRRQLVDHYCPTATLSQGRLRWVQPSP